MKGYRLLLVVVVALVLVVAALALRNYLAPSRTSAPPQPVEVEEPKVMREIMLYFAAPSADYLLPETREIEDCQEEEDCLRQAVQALIDGPTTSSVAVLPKQTVLRSIRVEGSLATVDFSGDLVSSHPGGSFSELMTVYGVANTLAANFPYIRQVQFLVDGQKRESLRGHVGIAEPVTADFRYSREPAAVVPDELFMDREGGN